MVDAKLSDIREDDILRILAGVRHLSPWTQSGVFKTVAGPLKLAMREGYVNRNAAASLLPEEKPRRGDRRQDILQPDDIQAVIDLCPPQHLALISLAIYSGLRQSELLGLRWKDIDLDKNTVFAGDQIDKHGNLTGRTKSDSRTVYIPAQVATNLKAHWLASRFKASGDFVFAAASGRPMSQEWAGRCGAACRLRPCKRSRSRSAGFKNRSCQGSRLRLVPRVDAWRSPPRAERGSASAYAPPGVPRLWTLGRRVRHRCRPTTSALP
jgi:integrase